MAICSTCAHNLLGYCPVWRKIIPAGKETAQHDCPEWRMERNRDVLQIVSGLIDTHQSDAWAWWVIRDMIEGTTPPPGHRSGALQVLWSAEYVDLQTRVAIAREFIPF
jgi:hypothetical protein